MKEARTGPGQRDRAGAGARGWTACADRIGHLVVKELIVVLRDPRLRSVLLFVPVFQVLLFGYIVSTDVKKVPTAVEDRDRSPLSRELVERFLGSGYFVSANEDGRNADARDLLDRGQVLAVLRIEPGLDADLRAGRTRGVQILLDGTDATTAGIVQGYAMRILREFSVDVVRRRRGAAGDGLSPAVDLRMRSWFNENLESRNFFVPGVIALLVSLVTLLLTSAAVVREKESGTLEQILVSPLRGWEFILGKTLPFALIAFVDMATVTAVGTFWFGVPFRGSFALLCLATALYILTTLGVGLMISTVSETQQQAMMTVFLFFFPSMLLSGFVFPVANMPVAVQWLTLANPLRYFLVVLRAVFLKGTGWAVLWPQLAAMAVLGTAVFALATVRLRRTMGAT